MRKVIINSSILLVFLFASFVAANAQEKTDSIKGGIVNGKAVVLPKPEYPKSARESCAGGKVEVEVLIGANGEVLEAKAISGDEMLRAASVEAAKKAKFTPVHGLPVKIKGIIVYNFDALAKCINAGIVNKRALNLPKPKVPNLGRPHLQIKEEQIVAVQIVVDINGKVITAIALTGHPLLRASCVIAARQAKFSPSFINGPPVRVRALLVYKFKPDGSIDTDIDRGDKDAIKTPVVMVEPPSISCNCGFGSANPKVVVMAEIDERGNVIKAEVVSGHPVLRPACKAAALSSRFLPLNIKSKLFITYSFEETSKWSVKFSGIEIKSIADQQ